MSPLPSWRSGPRSLKDLQMEKRLLLAIVLSFLVLFLYQALFVKKVPPSESPQITDIESSIEKQPEQPSVQGEASREQVLVEESSEKREFQPISEDNEEKIIINTSLYRAVWSNKGAQLISWKLKNYKDENGEELELVSALSSDINQYPFILRTEDPEFDQIINNSLYKSNSYQLDLIDGQSQEIRFEYADVDGNRIEKIFNFTSGKYTVDIIINAWKKKAKIEPRLLWGPSFGTLSATAKKRRFGSTNGIAVFVAQSVLRHDEQKYKPEESVYNFVQWAAYEDNYFAALFLTSPQKTSAAFLREQKNQFPYYFLSVSYAQKAYIGPKDIDDFNEFGYESKRLIKFGFFGFIAEILLKGIKSIHKVVPNWGLCIVILTFLIKIIFFPLTYKSTRSMAKMQELQPKIKALRAKYKKAKHDIAQRRKMNEETMRLYKEHGVNPAGGCLPILIQMPIFFGFFRLLVIALEFRHSPFILWIKDLSVKDPLYITPLLMGATQFISQKMTPTSGDPTQQRMMLIMPVVMTIFFMNFQSGLVLYWLTNNVLQIGQQYIINRITQKKKRESHAKRRKK